MRYRILDQNNDMTFGSSLNNFYIDTPAGVSQAILTRLKLWAGEWFLDLTEGTPYQQSSLGKGKAMSIEPAIRQRILETEGVKSIDSFNLNIDPNSRTASITTTVTTNFGQTQVEAIM